MHTHTERVARLQSKYMCGKLNHKVGNKIEYIDLLPKLIVNKNSNFTFL